MKKLLLFLSCFLCFACSDDKENTIENPEITMFVASETRKCSLVDEYECFIVRFRPDDPWQIMSDRIEGFRYVPGFEYELIVEKVHMENPPEDFIAWYTLKKVVSATEKQSENLPK